MEHFSSPHKHIVHAETNRVGVRCDGGKVCVWKSFPDVDSELLMHIETVSRRVFPKTFCVLKACNDIKKFDFRNLISTPTRSNAMNKEEFCSLTLRQTMNFWALTNYSALERRQTKTRSFVSGNFLLVSFSRCLC